MICPPAPSPSPAQPGAGAWRVSGRWFREATGAKVYLRGVTYGPFKPNAQGLPWPEEARLQDDFRKMAALDFNTVRVYEPPTEAVLQAARDTGLRLLVGIPWTQHVDFLSEPAIQAEAITRVQDAARRLGRDPVVAGLLVGNEIEKTLVRWMRPEPVRRFLEKLIATVKTEAPDLPVAYASYPSTEYLVPRNADFVAFNVFLEDKDRFEAYLKRLQILADGKPLVISEFGLDSKKHGEAAQARTLQWQQEAVQRSAVAGNFWFSFTDEWHRGGEEITGWEFGLVTRDRQPKLASEGLAAIPQGPPQSQPRISVIVCTRNGSATLRNCLAALGTQTYSNYEVLVIDDGSTDQTPGIAREFPFVKYHHQPPGGLSAARNHGMRLATGEILAYTDDDCIPDEDWLRYLAPAFDEPSWVAAGGPNLPPPPRSLTEACVAAAPGAPAHVLMGNEEAEHLPGCNLAIRKAALEAIGGFRVEFTTAGDDVDVCWRLQEQGGRLRFVPAAVVWHHRRFTVSAYLRQQTGYGLAEALLIGHFPKRFAWLGGARWRGAIYGDETYHGDLERQHIHFGSHGLAPFQCIYTGSGDTLAHWMSGLPWLVGSVAALALGFLHLAWLVVPALMLVLSIRVASKRAAMNDFMLIAHTWRHRALLWTLCFIQPVVRDWARLRGMMRYHALPKGKLQWPWKTAPLTLTPERAEGAQFAFWSADGVGREAWLEAFAKELQETHDLRCRPAGDWSLWDGSFADSGTRLRYVTVTEYHGGGMCLTRVKASTWSPGIPLFSALFYLSLILVRYLNWGGGLLLLSMVVPYLILVLGSILVLRRYKVAAQQAAKSVGMVPITPKQAPSLKSRNLHLPATALDSR
ncbi:glycosyltransferase [Verrucomicrobium sp. BvORR034]|uniref:glycosyltransferase n=1 Tax=Verrucomicrobium sp. BvORR034 TaxID=1396418 RepID=UPI000679B7B4|nr:glycosyltransferase [Verrucomicrobium sp. BvORR034]